MERNLDVVMLDEDWLIKIQDTQVRENSGCWYRLKCLIKGRYWVSFKTFHLRQSKAKQGV